MEREYSQARSESDETEITTTTAIKRGIHISSAKYCVPPPCERVIILYRRAIKYQINRVRARSLLFLPYRAELAEFPPAVFISIPV